MLFNVNLAPSSPLPFFSLTPPPPHPQELRYALGIWSILAYMIISQTSYNLHLLQKIVIICPPL